MWQINHQRCGLFFGSAAAILQIAHPRIAMGVAEHSQFDTDSLGRLRRTLAATNRIAFGTRDEAETTRQKLRKIHGGVRGQIAEGMEGRPGYSAFEPDLLLWVLATMIKAAIRGYELINGGLSRERAEVFYREMRQFGEYFGLDQHDGPACYREFEYYYNSMIHGELLGSHPLCIKLAHAIISPKDSFSARCIGKGVRFLPIETLPTEVRERLELKSNAATRASMQMLRRCAPRCFPLLPEKMRLYPESVERLQREKADQSGGF